MSGYILISTSGLNGSGRCWWSVEGGASEPASEVGPPLQTISTTGGGLRGPGEVPGQVLNQYRRVEIVKHANVWAVGRQISRAGLVPQDRSKLTCSIKAAAAAAVASVCRLISSHQEVELRLPAPSRRLGVRTRAGIPAEDA